MGNCAFCQRHSKKSKNSETSPTTSEEKLKLLSVHLQIHPHNPHYFDVITAPMRDEMVLSAERFAMDLHRMSLKSVVEARGGNVIYQHVKGMFEDQPGSSDLIQNFYGEELYAYPTLVLLFYLLNKDIDDPHIDVYELVDSDCQPDSIIILYRARTKKFLMVEPREYVIIRYIRRVGPSRVVDVHQSVDVLGLTTDPLVANALQRVKGALVKVYLKASIYEDKGLVCKGTTVVKSDMRSSSSLTILKPFLASSLKKSLTRMVTSLVEFYRRRQWEDGRKVLWFDNDYAKLVEAFEIAHHQNEKSKTPIEQRMEVKENTDHFTSL